MGRRSAATMTLDVRHGLPFVAVTLQSGERVVEVAGVLVDTGSAATLFRVETVSEIDLALLPTDVLRTMRGVGGVEYVVSKQVDRLIVAGAALDNVVIQVGSVEYGYGIEAILGMDALLRLGAVIDLAHMTLTTSDLPDDETADTV